VPARHFGGIDQEELNGVFQAWMQRVHNYLLIYLSTELVHWIFFI
jgi:hypothetical protein